MNFDKAVDIVLGFEGGYSFDANDPGGETKWGISKRAYPTIDIKDLDRDSAISIYRHDYWDKLGVDALHPKMRLLFFDTAVNMGPSAAKQMLQLSNAMSKDPSEIVAAFASFRLDKYRKMQNWKIYGGGWAKRLLEVALKSLQAKEN